MNLLSNTCVAIWLVFTLSTSAYSAPQKPNIILIISDDHGFPDYGFMGSKVVQTPSLDRIASESLVYTRGYTMPVCSPSLASLLTGKLPHQHGITGNDLGPSAGNGGRQALKDRLLSNSLMLPKALTDAGYLTFQTGKLWNGTYKDFGFTGGMTDKEGRHGGAGLGIGRAGMQPIFDFIGMAQKEQKPFFVWYAPFMPHTPHTPPAELLARYEAKEISLQAAKYYAMVEWFDQTCGELDNYLIKNNLKDNTVILYLADNGWNGAGKGHAKLTSNELGIRTPIFVRWPAKLKAQRDEQTLASVIDIAPSILNIAGAKAPSDLPGLDLLNREAMTARKSIFIENYTHDIADLAAPEKSLVTQVVLNGWLKLHIPGSAHPKNKPSQLKLVDLQSDVLEKTNLAASRPEDVKRLQALQESFWPAAKARP